MALLAKLGSVLYNAIGIDPTKTGPIGALATSMTSHPGVREWSVLLYNSMDSLDVTGETNITLSVLLPALAKPSPSLAAAVFLLDDEHGSSFAAWSRQGQPTFPTAAQFNEVEQCPS